MLSKRPLTPSPQETIHRPQEASDRVRSEGSWAATAAGTASSHTSYIWSHPIAIHATHRAKRRPDGNGSASTCDFRLYTYISTYLCMYATVNRKPISLRIRHRRLPCASSSSPSGFLCVPGPEENSRKTPPLSLQPSGTVSSACRWSAGIFLYSSYFVLKKIIPIGVEGVEGEGGK